MSQPPGESPGKDPSPPTLDVVQKWFQAVITHQAGVEQGVESASARHWIRLRRGEVEKVIRRSKRLTAEERLSIYAHAYYARLVQCLGESFPVLKRTLGDDIFESFAVEYLQRYPSFSYTLDRLGDRFPCFLKELGHDSRIEDSGSPGAQTGWLDFLRDLARLERATAQVFDGPGMEGQPAFSEEQMEALSPDRFSQCRLELAVCLRLITFDYPVNHYYGAVRKAGDDEVPIPAAQVEYVAIHRVNFVVRRYELNQAQKTLLDRLQQGATVGEAIQTVAETALLKPSELAPQLRSWFAFWTSEGFFRSLQEGS